MNIERDTLFPRDLCTFLFYPFDFISFASSSFYFHPLGICTVSFKIIFVPWRIYFFYTYNIRTLQKSSWYESFSKRNFTAVNIRQIHIRSRAYSIVRKLNRRLCFSVTYKIRCFFFFYFVLIENTRGSRACRTRGGELLLYSICADNKGLLFFDVINFTNKHY